MTWWRREDRTRTEAIKELFLKVAADPDRRGPRVIYRASDGRERMKKATKLILKFGQRGGESR